MGGCCSTDATKKTDDLLDDKSDGQPSSSGYASGPLTLEDINARITAPKRAQHITIGEYSVSFGYVSQRGYYPDSKYLIDLLKRALYS